MKGRAFHCLFQTRATKKRGRITIPSFLTKGRKERIRAVATYFSFRNRKMERISMRLKRISVIPLIIITA